MTAPDRTEELVLDMLARRAGGEVPEDLLGRALVAVAATRQASVARHSATASGGRRVPRLLVAAAVAAVPVLLVAVLAAGSMLGPAGGSSGPAGGMSAGPGATPAASVATAVPSASAATPPVTGASAPPALPHGSIAVVTLEGRNLRVRSQPTTDNAVSKKYNPTLPPGTRMLVVAGPVEADGMRWYQVQTDGEFIDLFGWVSTGQDGETWVEPRPPRCPEHVDASTIATLNRIDFLACYGDVRVKVLAKVADLWGPRETGPSCGWVRVRDATECRVDNRWLSFPDANVTLVTDLGNQHDIALAVPPDLTAKLLQVPRQATSVLTISMDAPEAGACRIRNGATGIDLVPAERAVTRCRLQFVLQEILVDPDAQSSEPPAG